MLRAAKEARDTAAPACRLLPLLLLPLSTPLGSAHMYRGERRPQRSAPEAQQGGSVQRRRSPGARIIVQLRFELLERGLAARPGAGRGGHQRELRA